jgi:hypothetical protein
MSLFPIFQGLAALVLVFGASVAGAEISRDCDGEVISVLPDYAFATGGPLRGGGVWVTDVGGTETEFAFRGNMVAGGTVTLNGAQWRVEQTGEQLLLVNPVGGERMQGVVRAAARPDMQGRRVNPTTFALD